MAREYFKVFHSYLKSIEPLNDAERGRLFTAMLEYSITGEAPDLRGNERFIFPTMQGNLDREIESYNRTVETNRVNGSKGGRPPKTERTGLVFQKPNESEKIQDKEKDKKEEKEKDSLPPKSPQEGQSESLDVETASGAGTPADPSTTSDRFEEFWAAYPRKSGKGAARKSWEKLNPDEKLFCKIISALEAQCKSEQWKRDHGQFIPYPATWLSQERWEDSPDPERLGHSRSYDIDEIERMSFFHLPDEL